MKLLFICYAGENRSPTGADVAVRLGHEGRYAGIRSADDEKLRELLNWADIVFVMERWMRKELSERFPAEYLKKRIVVLDLLDIYQREQPDLAEILEEEVQKALE